MNQIRRIAILVTVVALSGCAELASLIGPAATAAGAGVGAYEKALQDAQAAKATSKDKAEVIAAIERARAEAAKRAAEDKARDEQARAKLEALAAELAADAHPCPVCPTCPPAPPAADAGSP